MQDSADPWGANALLWNNFHHETVARFVTYYSSYDVSLLKVQYGAALLHLLWSVPWYVGLRRLHWLPVRRRIEFSWLCSYTSRWMVQYLATCPMPACLRCWPPSASFIWWRHLCGPSHSHRLRWPGLPSRWTQTLEQSAGFTASVRHDSRPVQETTEDSFV